MELRGSVWLPLSLDAAWDLWVDAARFPQWQSMLLAVRDLSGPVGVAGTTYTLDHGPRMQRHVRVLIAERPVRHVIEQTGMKVHDQTSATFEREGEGTRLTLVVHARLGRIMGLLARLSPTERELQKELDRLPAIASRRPPPARAGGLYLAEAGTARRRLTVIGLDDDRVHVRLHPGHLTERDPVDRVPPPPKPLSDQMDLWPIPVPIRASTDAAARGLPFLRRDGGHGVDHLALSLSAWADAAPVEIGEEAVTTADGAALDAWRRRRSPTVGVDADLDLAPVCSLRLDPGPDAPEAWAVAKVLRSQIMRIHLALPKSRWHERPVDVPSWSTAPPEPSDSGADDVAAILASWPVSIGHYPVNRSAFRDAAPQFVGVATLEDEELEGYRIWATEQGGTFDSFLPILGPVGPLDDIDDRLTRESGLTLGDRARVSTAPATERLGLDGRIGVVYGLTTPSADAGQVEVVGESAMDIAVGVELEGDDHITWIAAELLEFVEHDGAREAQVGERRFVRGPDGQWTMGEDPPPET